MLTKTSDPTAAGVPQRIQRQRTKGWKMPPNTVYVGRPTKWGNPFKLWNGRLGDAWEGYMPERAVAQYQAWLEMHPKLRTAAERELRGKNLACWCPLTAFCHADVLLEIANAPAATLCLGGGR